MNGQKQSLEIIVQNDNSDLTVPVTTKLVLVDVPSSHWARNVIDRLVTKGIIKGFQGGTFKPESLVTREQFVTMLVQAKNLEGFEVKTIFTDVPEGHWSARYVSAAVSSGILIPREYGGHFRGTNPISREESTVLLARALKLKGDSWGIVFKDKRSIKNRFLIGAAVKAQIINGFPDQTFRPKESLTRAQAAQLINKLIP
ncbi:S-layer homology domain-containing protein [Brevibacillus laterosporus]|uniref:S-layer homology domain-containing protein n=1 Tax=Brevibacillus laterosporus TaxID=1465 RepID=UPI00215BD373|nr:S-layer homology domain-containing protein [Brevibacillus laterosporus]MCR8939262.1 S-layer homology domain-containing protein [Brevibacillus laterosporus]MCZ0841902.1 S-layer homology domain-containing protein [Brevibacillus laterosporus]MCZ0846905.1 S-layer homology domain-containing protein [Brevibacillus laterosporus]